METSQKTQITIFLDEKLPKQYLEPSGDIEEEPLTSVEELCRLYETKYGTFGAITFHVLSDSTIDTMVNALNELFSYNQMAISVDQKRLLENREKLLPMIVVDHEIVSRGVYPDLTQMRGGSNSVNRGGSGHSH